MAEVIYMPDGEQVVVDFITSIVPGSPWDGVLVAVGTKVPDPRPDCFVRVLRTGGLQRNLVLDGGTYAIEAWHLDEAKAAGLSRWLRAEILSAARAGAMGSTVVPDDVVEYSGPANLPDPRTGHSRYTFTHEIPMRGSTTA